MKKLKYPTLLISLLMLFSVHTVHAYDMGASLGNLCEFVGKIQTDDSGGTNVCSFNPYLAAFVDYPINNRFLLSPEVGFSFPQSGRDESIDKMSIVALANAKYKFSNYHLIAGLGLFFTRIAGSGGTQELSNGTGTSSFPMPESTVYTRNFILNLGFGADFDKEWSADIHTYVFNALTSEDRAFSIAINGTYHFGEFE
ncbi:MAG: hypothetical protein WC635_09275 [Bacteriovorax sp.]|jgi:hypothetical protein